MNCAEGEKDFHEAGKSAVEDGATFCALPMSIHMRQQEDSETRMTVAGFRARLSPGCAKYGLLLTVRSVLSPGPHKVRFSPGRAERLFPGPRAVFFAPAVDICRSFSVS